MSEQILKEAFVLTCDRMKRYQGEWHVEKSLLFPNYIFLDTENGQVLNEELRADSNIAKILKVDDTFLVMHKEEEQLLKLLCGDRHHIGMSRGVIQKGITKITDGPLRGMEKLIKKIDRHKRIAKLEVTVTGLEKNIHAGLEIVKKS